MPVAAETANRSMTTVDRQTIEILTATTAVPCPRMDAVASAAWMHAAKGKLTILIVVLMHGHVENAVLTVARASHLMTAWMTSTALGRIVPTATHAARQGPVASAIRFVTTTETVGIAVMTIALVTSWLSLRKSLSRSKKKNHLLWFRTRVLAAQKDILLAEFPFWTHHAKDTFLLKLPAMI